MTDISRYTQLEEKIFRRILDYSENLMLVEYLFKAGGIGKPHQHDAHEQIGYIAQGSFELTIGNETKIIKRGDTYCAPKNIIHGVVALEDDSIIIDAFTPLRKDLLE